MDDAEAAKTIPYQAPHVHGAEVRRTRRRRAKIVVYATLGLLLAGVVTVLYVCMGLGQRSRAVELAGPAQIVGNESAAWLFLDIERSVRAPGIIAGAPRRRVIDRVAVAFNGDGVLRQLSLPVGPPDTFNENLSIVFGL